MKLFFALLFVLTINTYGQPAIVFQNDQRHPVMSCLVPGVRVTAADGVAAALYWGLDSDPMNFMQLGAPTGVGTVPGLFNGGNRALPGPPDLYFFEVRIWELAYGSTYEQAAAAPEMNGRPAMRLLSNIMPINFEMVGPSVNIADHLQGFTCVPEPSSYLLLALGAGALAWTFRSRSR